MFIIVLILLSLLKVETWKTQQIGNNVQTCQAFSNSEQQECTSDKIIVTKVEALNLICLIGQDTGYSSYLHIDAQNYQYFITLINSSIQVYPLPINCVTNPIDVGISKELKNYSMTGDSTNLYVFGGINGASLDNNLNSYNLQDLVAGRLTQVELPNNYISNLTVTLTLWDNTLEDYMFTNNIPSIAKLQKLSIPYTVNSQNDSKCPSTFTPGCIQNAVLIYNDQYDCLQLFYGVGQDKNIQMKSWAYYLKSQIWQLMGSDNLSTVNVVGSKLSELNSIGFYGNNKYFFYSEGNWFDNYGTVSFGEYFQQMIAYQNITILVNTSSIIYSDLGNAISQQYGIYTCEDNYSGYDCQISNNLCPGSVCFSDLFYGKICIYCSGHGTCQNGQCKCNEGYQGNDCGNYTKCASNCTSVGSCIEYFPLSQCRCPQDQKRGGEDCSVIFCLNDCSNSGTCKQGVCNCNSGSKGDDCSILSLKFIDE